MMPEWKRATTFSRDCNMPNMPLPQVHRLFNKRALPGAVMRTNDDLDYVFDDDDVAVMFTDDAGRAYIALGNVEDLALSESELDKNKLADCAYLNRLEKTYQSRVPVDDGDALFVLRWYDEVGSKGRILSGYQNAGVVQYRIPFAIGNDRIFQLVLELASHLSVTFN